jgi:ubiquinone biosynthesis protein
VARSLNPQINIWQVASPIVTDYISKSIGPKAVLSDLGKTARVLARFGPRLPALVESLLIQQGNSELPKRAPFWRGIIVTAALSACAGAGILTLTSHVF